jgi:soluble P-type ATPase
VCPDTCATVGNGNNDVEMLTEAALGIVVLGREGTSPRALMAADLIAQSITEALDLLLDAQALNATLRS